MKSSQVCSNWRFDVLLYALIFLSVIIILRLFQIQVLNSSRYKAQAREQHWEGIPLQAKRGNIYTADGFPIATVNTRYVLYLDLTRNIRSLDLYSLLSPLIDTLDKFQLDTLLESDRKWSKIADDLTWEQKLAIEGLDIPGLVFEETYKRYYPEETMLSHVLGFVGSDEKDNAIGYYGLEQYYDGDLQGQSGWVFQEKSAQGDPILWGESERIDSVDGSDLVLTVDRVVQYIIEESLREGVPRYAARTGTIIVLDPQTGGVLGMANYPNFHPLDYSEQENVRNAAISVLYEPGSVMKGITMSAAIDSGKVNPLTIYQDTGPKYFSGYKVDNWDGKHHGEETMIEVLQHSNNLGAAWVGQLLGGKSLMKYFSSFGYGTKFDIDLEDEESGVIYTKFPLKDIETVNASFGQGIAVTPLQVAASFGVIANNGYLMKPYIVSEVRTSDANLVNKPLVQSRPISEESSEVMVEMLREAVAGGEAKFFVSKKYHISGKTGTAQVPIPGGYDEDKTNATFVGFFTNYRNFVLLVKLEEPSFPSGYAAETAVPLWMETAEKLANYYGLQPDRK